MTILTLLVALILIGLAFWGTRAICAAFSIPAPIATVVQVLLVVVVVIWLLQATGMWTSGPVFRVR
jgi:hypothetical protein